MAGRGDCVGGTPDSVEDQEPLGAPRGLDGRVRDNTHGRAPRTPKCSTIDVSHPFYLQSMCIQIVIIVTINVVLLLSRSTVTHTVPTWADLKYILLFISSYLILSFGPGTWH